MFCEKYVEPGILYLYDELEPTAKQIFEMHLSVCAQCRKELAALKEGKLFVQMLPREEIAPIAYASVAASLKRAPNSIAKRLHELWIPLRSFFAIKSRLLLLPAGVAVLVLLMSYLRGPAFTFFTAPVSHDNETAFAWEVGVGESLEELEQKIAQMQPENPFSQMAEADSTFTSSVDNTSDEQLAQIEANIQSLASELGHLNF